MKRVQYFSGFLALLLLLPGMLGLVGCAHVHEEVIDAAIAPTCIGAGKTEGTHCATCGQVLIAQEETQPTGEHAFSKDWSGDYSYHYRTCLTPGCTAVTQKIAHPPMEDEYGEEVCLICVGFVHDTCVFEEVTRLEYLVSAATPTACATYYKSCYCGKASQETFTPVIEDKENYQPRNLTVTLFDTDPQHLTYGLTWNSMAKPGTSVVQVTKTETAETLLYPATVTAYNQMYVCKVAITLSPGQDYTYSVLDLCTGARAEEVALTALDPSATSFTFASISDSQDSDNNGGYFGNVLQAIGETDFYLHTGDICQSTAKEESWTAMVGENADYLTKTPLMIAAGNHDVSAYSLFHHFHLDLPEQADTSEGFYYSFDYGNAKFIVLNTNELTKTSTLKEDQFDWLLKTLEENTQTWTIVYMHVPMFSVGKWGSDPTRNGPSIALRGQLASVFAAYGVDLVIQGHDHTVSKTHPYGKKGVTEVEDTEVQNGITYAVDPAGTIYIMNGPAGSQSRGPVSTYEIDCYEYAEAGRIQSFAEYTINGNQLTVSVKYYDSVTEQIVVYDEWGIMKTPAA